MQFVAEKTKAQFKLLAKSVAQRVGLRDAGYSLYCSRTTISDAGTVELYSLRI